MPSIEESIGTKFERFLGQLYWKMSPKDNGPNVPDFYVPNYGFWVEAKAGNIQWGARIKGYQVMSFRELDERVVHAIGFHDFDNANEGLRRKTERQRPGYLDRYLQVLQVCFISEDIIERIWEKEKRMNQKGTTEYCSIKLGLVNNLMMRRQFKRFGKAENPEHDYGFSYDDYAVFDGMFESDSEGILYRGMLHREKDVKVIQFLKDNKIYF